MFQSTVNRNFTTGFQGDLINDGPHRAKPGRIMSATIGTDPAFSTNRISRVFGWSAELGATGTTLSARGAQVVVGGPTFFGLLGHPKHYALAGTTAGGTLAPTLDLPLGANAEFFDMVTGIVAEIFNFTTAAVTIGYGAQLAYVPNNITVANNPLALPYGALVAFAAGAAVPTGLVLIPNARVINAITLAASAVGALVSGLSIAQLTQ